MASYNFGIAPCIDICAVVKTDNIIAIYSSRLWSKGSHYYMCDRWQKPYRCSQKASDLALVIVRVHTWVLYLLIAEHHQSIGPFIVRGKIRGTFRFIHKVDFEEETEKTGLWK